MTHGSDPVRILQRCLVVGNLERQGYHMLKKVWWYVKPFQCKTGVWQMDRIAVSISCVCIPVLTHDKQELSYRKQITHQLCRQYVKGISVTFKCKLRDTQGHWKRNHWIDHTRLTITRVIWRWILSWPLNVGQRSLKVIENGTIWKLGYGFLFGFYSNYGRIFSHFGDIQRQRMIWPWNLHLESFKVIEHGAVW